MSHVPEEYLPLQRLHRWERERGDQICMTQPLGGGATRDFTWAEALGEARRMATHLKSFGWPPGTHVAILSKNCAWWLMADYAIWLAGFVSVPVYPTLTAASVRQILEHSEAKACFVGKLDDWERMKDGVPAGLRCLRFPLSPEVDCAALGRRRRARRRRSPAIPCGLPTISRRSSTPPARPARPKGAMHPFSSFAEVSLIAERTFHTTANERLLSYLPLAHVADRLASEVLSLQSGCRVYFAESLDTFQQDLQRARPTIFMSVPRLWTKFQQGVFAKMPKAKLDRLFRIPIVSRIVKRGFSGSWASITSASRCRARRRYPGRGARVVPLARAGDARGLRHDRELRGLALLAPRAGAAGLRRHAVGRRGDADRRRRRAADPEPCQHDRLLQGSREDPRSLHRRPLPAHRRRRRDRRDGPSQDHRPRQGAIQDQQGQVRGAGADREPARHPSQDRGEPRHRRRVSAAVRDRDAERARRARASSPSRRRATSSRARCARISESVNAQLDPHEQLAFVAVVSDQWTEANGLVTPTLKVKRMLVEDRYRPFFDAWARAGRPVVWQVASP